MVVKTSKFDKFKDSFWTDYNQKNYEKIANNCGKLLCLECTPGNENSYNKICIWTIISMAQVKNFNEMNAREIFKKILSMIVNTNRRTAALKDFLAIERIAELEISSKFFDETAVFETATAIFNKIESDVTVWKDDELAILNRFIIVLVRFESMDQRCGLLLTKFNLAVKAIETFSSKVTDDRRICWPEYMHNALYVLRSYRDEKSDLARQFVEKIKCLKNGQSVVKKDVAIMVSQILRAGASVVSHGSVKFIENIFIIINDLYDIVRDKRCTSYDYILDIGYSKICCENMNTHAGLQTLEMSRIILVDALKRDSFNEVLISMMSNFVVGEADVLEYLNCEMRANILHELFRALNTVADNIEKIVNNCGRNRAVRTLEKFLSIKVCSRSCKNRITTALSKIFQQSDKKALQINGHALKLFNSGSNRQFKLRAMYDIHLIQKNQNDPKSFETISSIFNSLQEKFPEAPNSHLNPIQLQLLQIQTEFLYPVLPETYLQRLVADMCKMDFFLNDQSCYANLNRCGICYLQYMIYVKRYKSKIEVKTAFDELKEDLVLLKSEIESVKKLLESFDYLTKFLASKDIWMATSDKDVYISFAEEMLQRISENLINRQYKHLAVHAFTEFYQFAKSMDRPLKQIYAAGYLVENIHLASSMVSGREIVTELQSNIMRKLKDVDAMSVDELGNFLLSFLQLSMYTMRYQHNVDHAKKYIQAVKKLLTKFDSENEKYLAARIKYAEVMFELIVRDSNNSITPITYIEDIFHRFKNIRFMTKTDCITIPGILFDLMSTVYAFTQPRYEFRYNRSLFWTIHYQSLKNGQLLLFAKTAILTSSECLLIGGKHLVDHLKQLDVLFECKTAGKIEKSSHASKVKTVTWNKEITSLLHPDNCECFQCVNKFLKVLRMEVASVKAWAVYFNKDYDKSLQSFKQIYDHWTASNTSSYTGMLMNYSNCMISNGRKEESNVILNEALTASNDYAQTQDISVHLVLDAVQDVCQIEKKVRSYAKERRPKTTIAERQKNIKAGLPNVVTKVERKIYPKRTNLRN